MIKFWFNFLGGIVLIISCLILFPKNVEAYFTTNASSANNTLSSGWWVTPTVAVNSPNGGETLYQGDTYNITWTATASDPLATVGIDIFYSTDGGATYPNTIATGETNDGSYSWTIPAVFSSSAKIKVVATDSHGLIGLDESNNNFTIKSGVVLNEFVPNPVGADNAAKPGGEWVELFNNGTTAIDVNNWVLYDVNDTHELIVSSANTNTGATIVAPGGFLVVYRDGDGDFELNNTGGDTVRLYNNAIGSGGVLIDSYAYTTDAAAGKSYARIPDGTGAWVDPDPTPGGPNVLTENYLLNLVTDEVGESTSSATVISQENSQPSLVLQAESTPSAEVVTSTPTPDQTLTPTPAPLSVISETPMPTPTLPISDLSPTPTLEQSSEPETTTSPDPPQEGDS